MTSTVKPVQHLVVEGVIPIMDMHPTHHVNMDHVESMPYRIKAVLRAGSVCVCVCGRDMVEMEAYAGSEHKGPCHMWECHS